jgi:hypothetical protein
MLVMGFDHKLIVKSPLLPRWLDWLKMQKRKGARRRGFLRGSPR